MVSADPGSFRDPASRIVFDGDQVLRLLDARGLEAWKELRSSTFYKKAVGSGKLIESSEIASPDPDAAGALEQLIGLLDEVANQTGEGYGGP